MIELILTGHGRYASGLQAGMEMIAGVQDHFHIFEFLDGDDSQLLYQQLADLFSRSEAALVLADLAGGSPFQMAVLAGRDFVDVEVIGGANQPMVLEAVYARDLMDVHALARNLEQVGRDSVRRFPKR